MTLPKVPSTAELLECCHRWIRRYVLLSEHQLVVLAIWVLHTWAIEGAECTPYLHITAPEKGSGKTRLLEALEPIVCRPWFTGRVTAAVLVRKVDAEKPTLLLDESDAAFGGSEEYSEALRGILNTGFKRGGKVSLCVGKGADVTFKDFSCFGAKAIAGIGKIPETVASRSIVIEMRRKTVHEYLERLRFRDTQEAAKPIVAVLERWASSSVDVLRDARPSLPAELKDREQDICEPLVAIADMAGGEWPERVRRGLVALFRSAASEDGSIGVMLLRDIRRLFEERDSNGQKCKSMFSADLAAELRAIEGRPWADWAHGKGMDPNRLAKQLKRYGISPQTIRLGSTTQKGYERAFFEDAWSRYCDPTEPGPVTPVTICVGTEENSVPHPSQIRELTEEPSRSNPLLSSIVTHVTGVTAVHDCTNPEMLFQSRES